MPSTSIKQQRAMGMAHAAQKGDIPMSSLHGSAKGIAKSMKPKDVKHFAKTKHKGLPKQKEAAFVQGFLDGYTHR